MTTEIVIPVVGKLGNKYDIVQVVEWKAKEGDFVDRDSTILIVETDKASADIPAGASGFLHILVETGGRFTVGTVAGVIAETEEELQNL